MSAASLHAAISSASNPSTKQMKSTCNRSNYWSGPPPILQSAGANTLYLSPCSITYPSFTIFPMLVSAQSPVITGQTCIMATPTMQTPHATCRDPIIVQITTMAVSSAPRHLRRRVRDDDHGPPRGHPAPARLAVRPWRLRSMLAPPPPRGPQLPGPHRLWLCSDWA